LRNSGTEPRFLTVEEVLYLHQDAIFTYGGADGINDIGLVESAVMGVQQTFDGTFLHPNLFSMAAAYWWNIAQNHGLYITWAQTMRRLA